MSRFQAGMSFYAQMPDAYSMVLNSEHALLKDVLSTCKSVTDSQLKPINSEIKGLEARLAALRQTQNGKKPEEVTSEEKAELEKTEASLTEQRNKKQQILTDYAKEDDIVHQLIDLALLQNGMLKGAALDAFLKRSVDLINKKTSEKKNEKR
jgi:chaperone htpG